MSEQSKFEALEKLKHKIRLPQNYDNELIIRVYSNMMEWLIYENTIDEFEEGFLKFVGIYEEVVNIVGKKEITNTLSQEVWEERLRIK